MSPALGDALHDLAGDVGDLGDIERALRDVRNRRVRIAAGAVAATCLAAVLVILAVPTPASVEPASPEPRPPIQVIQRGDEAITDISRAPLPGGADVAAHATGPAVVMAGGESRRVGNSGRLYWTTVSPDGRIHAASDGSLSLSQAAESGTGRGDVLVVTDLTTGRELLRWQMQIDGRAAQAPRYVWSGDAQRLFLVVISTDEVDEDPAPRGLLHVWQREGDSFVPVGVPSVLPGTLIGVDEGGTRAVVEDDGALVELSIESRDVQPLNTGGIDYRVPAQRVPDLRAWGSQLGQGCWDPALNRVCWVGLGDGLAGVPEVGWLDLGTGTWTWLPASLTGWVTFVGWVQGDPVLLGDDGPTSVRAVRLTGRGPVTLRVFEFGHADGVANRIALPDPSRWSAS